MSGGHDRRSQGGLAKVGVRPRSMNKKIPWRGGFFPYVGNFFSKWEPFFPCDGCWGVSLFRGSNSSLNKFKPPRYGKITNICAAKTVGLLQKKIAGRRVQDQKCPRPHTGKTADTYFCPSLSERRSCRHSIHSVCLRVRKKLKFVSQHSNLTTNIKNLINIQIINLINNPINNPITTQPTTQSTFQLII